MAYQYEYDNMTHRSCPLDILQRACSYVYDAFVVPYLAQTWSTTTTLFVITDAFQNAPAPTATALHSNGHKRKSSNKQGIYSLGSDQPKACGLQPAASLYDYDTTMAAYESIDPTTHTTIHNTITTYTQTTNQAPQLPAKTTTTTRDAKYYYGYRYYSPELGRWVSRDPIGLLGGANLYAMVANAVLSQYDHLGLLTRGNANSIVNSVLGSMVAAPGAGILYEHGSDECMERDLKILSDGIILDAFTESIVSIMFSSLGTLDPSLLVSIGLTGLEQLINELTTGDGSLDEEEIIGLITGLFGSLTPGEVDLLLPLANEIIDKEIGDLFDEGRLVQKHRSMPTPEVGTEVACSFYVTAQTSGTLLESYSKFALWGSCESSCKPGGAITCKCGCSSKFDVVIEGEKNTWPTPPTISKKEFTYISE